MKTLERCIEDDVRIFIHGSESYPLLFASAWSGDGQILDDRINRNCAAYETKPLFESVRTVLIAVWLCTTKQIEGARCAVKRARFTIETVVGYGFEKPTL